MRGVPSIARSTVAESRLIINGFLITKSLWLGENKILLLKAVFHPIFVVYLANIPFLTF